MVYDKVRTFSELVRTCLPLIKASSNSPTSKHPFLVYVPSSWFSEFFRGRGQVITHYFCIFLGLNFPHSPFGRSNYAFELGGALVVLLSTLQTQESRLQNTIGQIPTSNLTLQSHKTVTAGGDSGMVWNVGSACRWAVLRNS